MKKDTVHYFCYLKREQGIYLRSTSHVDHWKRSALLDLLIGSDLDSSSSPPFIGFPAPVIASYNCWLNDPLTGRQVTDRSDVTLSAHQRYQTSEYFRVVSTRVAFPSSFWLLAIHGIPNTGEWNIPFLRCYSSRFIVIMCGSTRIQFIASGRTYILVL